MARVVVGHGAGTPLLQRQSELGAIEGLGLALLVDREDDRMVRRVHVEADDVVDLGAEGRVGGALEGSDVVRLETMVLPDALDGA